MEQKKPTDSNSGMGASEGEGERLLAEGGDHLRGAAALLENQDTSADLFR